MANKKITAFIAILLLVILVGSAAALLFTNQPSNQPLDADYWILNISPTQTETGTVTPNWTIYVPLNQTGITVTATPLGINGFMHWRLDGQIVQNQSATIFVPKQEANSNHTLQAVFVIGTPTITPFPKPSS
jgi:hypothetical protein